jgi:hypothetical protein
MTLPIPYPREPQNDLPPAADPPDDREERPAEEREPAVEPDAARRWARR